MRASLLDELLDDVATPTPAKAANSANRQQWRGLKTNLAPCEDLRIVANGQPAASIAAQDSQPFAAVRRPPRTLEREERRCFSQDSQDSQPLRAQGETAQDLDLSAVAWTEGDIARFLDRRARLLRWGWAPHDTEALADKLVRRDREADTRVSCTDCRHHRPGRCGNHRRAGLHGDEVGRDLAGLLQRCPGFSAAKNSEASA